MNCRVDRSDPDAAVAPRRYGLDPGVIFVASEINIICNTSRLFLASEINIICNTILSRLHSTRIVNYQESLKS
uniref:Uncharacterized protein n=1 Tax=Manihot esculenta TaxID=3983 RepID=A0A2C9U528_MANES